MLLFLFSKTGVNIKGANTYERMFLHDKKAVELLKRIVDQLTDKDNNEIKLEDLLIALVGEDFERRYEIIKDTIKA